jgi:lysophospholipase L1-like esterase
MKIFSLPLIIALLAGSGNAVPATGAREPLVVALGDSITYGYGLPSPATQSYAALYAASIGATLKNLAVPGAVCQDVLDRQIARMPAQAAIVIVNCGTNDVGGFDFTPARVTRAPAATDAELAGYERVFAKVLARVRAKEPAARIYLINLRHWERIGAAEPPQFAKDVNVWNAMLVATHVPVVDITDDARMYDLAYFQHDELHPNVAGHKVIAGLLRAASRRAGGPG